jgi:hypothetical protein
MRCAIIRQLHGGQLRNHCQGILRAHIQFRMILTKMMRNGFSMDGFAVTILLRTDGEGLNRPQTLSLNQRNDGGAVHALPLRGSPSGTSDTICSPILAKSCDSTRSTAASGLPINGLVCSFHSMIHLPVGFRLRIFERAQHLPAAEPARNAQASAFGCPDKWCKAPECSNVATATTESCCRSPH